eukprot:TRINITY_DN2415_c0_g1_i1.p1 TRINITY_DN2415_c0_g1~~TRINITY_DN2415_c0_g1_i1.p1  ORF type:complete len:147 (-),score=29.50 TRINITY_DN2415_c0_g1_i1:108-548(-)
MQEYKHIDGVDHVEHGHNSKSPGNVGDVEGWYMHPHQQDNLLVCRGVRTSILRRSDHPGQEEVFEVSRNCVKRNGTVVSSEACVLQWEPNTFHKVNTTSPEGSTSINFAVRFAGFDLATEFNIYALDIATMKHTLLRRGGDDQAPS